MAAYLIANVKVTNADGYREYAEKVPATIAQYGGRYVVRGGAPEILEPAGDDDGRIVVLEFDDRDTLMRWFNSPEYSAIKGIRHANSDASVIVVDGA